MKEKDQFGLDVEYEFITVKLNDNDSGKLEFFQNGKKDFINIVGRGEIIIKRRKYI
jgi:hypothetical protein